MARQKKLKFDERNQLVNQLRIIIYSLKNRVNKPIPLPNTG